MWPIQYMVLKKRWIWKLKDKVIVVTVCWSFFCLLLFFDTEVFSSRWRRRQLWHSEQRCDLNPWASKPQSPKCFLTAKLGDELPRGSHLPAGIHKQWTVAFVSYWVYSATQTHGPVEFTWSYNGFYYTLNTVLLVDGKTLFALNRLYLQYDQLLQVIKLRYKNLQNSSRDTQIWKSLADNQ